VTSAGENKFPAQIANTFGSENAGPRIGPVVINEVRYHPLAGEEEFIELKNISGAAVKLYDPLYPTNTWKLNGAGFTFPTNTEIPAGGLLILAADDPATFRARNAVPASVPVLGPFSGTLQDNGELLQLLRPDKPDTNDDQTIFVPYIVVDEVRYSDESPWPVSAADAGSSLERIVFSAYGNDPINWQSRPHGATPGVENDQNVRPYVDAGGDASISANSFPAEVSLHGIAIDDGLPLSPGSLTISWTQISGPAPVAFASSNQPETMATFPKIGNYVLRLTADDGELSNSNEITVSVERGTFPVTLVPQGADWKYKDDGSNQGIAWRELNFDDSLWASGPAKLGYGDADDVTVVNSGPSGSRIITTYFRRKFVVSDAENINGLIVRLLRDDGGVVYLNGDEIFRSNMPGGTITSTTLASVIVSDADETAFFETNVSPAHLVNGTNILAVEIHQIHQNGTDMGFNLDLIGDSWGTNHAPTVQAGENFSVILPEAAQLNGVVGDDGLPLSPGVLSVNWSKFSGPGEVSFANSTAPVTTAEFSASGVYVLRLTGSDGALNNFSSVTVFVLAETYQSWANATFSSNQLTDPNISGADADPDFDSVTNGDEFSAGTKPLDGQSFLHIEQIHFDSNANEFSFRFEVPARRNYSVQFRDSLATTDWNTLTNFSAAAESRMEIFNPPTAVERYYRLTVPAQP
jgi:hypothetical protein